MKRYILTVLMGLLFVIFGRNIKAQNLTYHAMAMDTNSVLFQNQRVSLRISIMQGSVLNTVYSESFIATSDSMGFTNFTIGDGTVIFGSADSVNWGSTSNLVKIEIDPNAGHSYYEIGKAPLNSPNNFLLPNQR